MSSRPVVALAFDGVICCSASEVLLTGLEAYVELVPSSRLGETLKRFRNAKALSAIDIERDPLSLAFLPLLPLGNRAEDFGVALCALEAGVSLPNQESYDTYYQSLQREWLASYHECFYACRVRNRQRDENAWVRLHKAYDPFVDILRRNASHSTFAIATAKDGRSVRLLLDSFGIADLFESELILDKDTAVEKHVHLSLIAERTGVDLSRVTFIDDKVNHLERVAHLNVRPVLASWGYNTPREEARARELGFTVSTLETAELTLFGGEI